MKTEVTYRYNDDCSMDNVVLEDEGWKQPLINETIERDGAKWVVLTVMTDCVTNSRIVFLATDNAA